MLHEVAAGAELEVVADREPHADRRAPVRDLGRLGSGGAAALVRRADRASAESAPWAGARSLAPYELALLEPLASTRGQSLAELLLTSAVVEARREEERGTDDDGDEARAEVVALDAIKARDLIYTDLRGLPRGPTERVTAVQREHNLWRVEFESGPPAWFGQGARVWRKRKRTRT
jgi:hypothetical protein